MIRSWLFALQCSLEHLWLGGALRIGRMMAISRRASPSDSMKVFVHVANYNGEAWISEALESILIQSHQNWMLLVIDDASEDKSRDIINEFASRDNRIKFIINEENMGTAKTHNRAIDIFLSQDECEAFCILDCDDVACEDWLSIGVGALRSGALGLRPILSRYDENLKQKQWDYIGCNQTFWSKEVIRDLGWYRLKPYMYDHDFMERAKRYATLRGRFILQSAIPLQKMRMRGSNQSLQQKSSNELEAERHSVMLAKQAGKIESLFVPMEP